MERKAKVASRGPKGGDPVLAWDVCFIYLFIIREARTFFSSRRHERGAICPTLLRRTELGPRIGHLVLEAKVQRALLVRGRAGTKGQGSAFHTASSFTAALCQARMCCVPDSANPTHLAARAMLTSPVRRLNSSTSTAAAMNCRRRGRGAAGRRAAPGRRTGERVTHLPRSF